MKKRLFLSSATKDFGLDRVSLAALLRKAGYVPILQEEFAETGFNTLERLEASIRDESEVVIHIMGSKPGALPPANVVEKFLEQIDGDAFKRRFPELFDANAYLRLSYTEWEPWLARFFKKRVPMFRIQIDGATVRTKRTFPNVS